MVSLFAQLHAQACTDAAIIDSDYSKKFKEAKLRSQLLAHFKDLISDDVRQPSDDNIQHSYDRAVKGKNAASRAKALQEQRRGAALKAWSLAKTTSHQVQDEDHRVTTALHAPSHMK